MDDTRLLLTDAAWGRIAAALAEVKHPAGAPAKLSDRDFVEAVLYLARTGLPWRDLPGRFGAWDAVYNRFRRWVHSGRLKRLFELLTADPQFGDVRRAFLDSSVIRAHLHAAGAARKKSGSGRLGRRRGKASGARAAATAARSS